jgi:hypothetical protein
MDGIGLFPVTTAKVTNSVVTGTGYGIQTNQGTGSRSGNTVTNFLAFGIVPDDDGIAVTGNKILNGSSVGWDCSGQFRGHHPEQQHHEYPDRDRLLLRC